MSDVTTGDPTNPRAIVIDGPKRDFVGSLGIAARDNPAAAALIAMGAVWLFAGGGQVSILGSRKSPRSRRSKLVGGSHAPAVVGLYAEGALAAAEDAAGGARQTIRRAGETTGDLVGRATTLGKDAVGATVDVAGTMRESISSAVSHTGSAVSEAGMATSRVVQNTADTAWSEVVDLGLSVREVLEDRPLAIAALSLAAGAGLALVLPRTQVEQDLVGEQSEALQERAGSLASERIGDVREGGEAAFAQAIREARANGITEDVVKSAVEDFTARLGKVARAAREGASS
ncbi:hypothetical protein E4L95_09820 [Paracoccus liaowanqingii]|uniref:DUF3618 domain-containing protein n=1 Tax=Paracoccus liaowanqingii TaxID=2560053 RepID=A0A4Z1C9L9_9RHOB|nr:hypothetical protein [Paracoccus liaowanqingii]TGN61587.1 hypothetical protein E4L95_09820 [Paracoccus liaowanqingii]